MHVLEIVAFLLLLAALFASAEVLRRRGVSADASRRYTHASGASVAAVLPGFLSLPETVVIGVLVAAFLAWTRAHGLLRSVHGVERPTLGAILFPVGLALAAIVGWVQPASYSLAAITFALADPAAAIAGEQVAGPRWRVTRGTKSAAGSVAFAVVAAGVGLVAGIWLPLSVPAILAIAIGLAIVEGTLGYGLDNLVLPPAAAISFRLALGA